MKIDVNLREFGWIVVLEKRLGFEGSSNLHRFLVEFLGLILLILERESNWCLLSCKNLSGMAMIGAFYRLPSVLLDQ
jgi:hypothetical protein